MWIPLVPVAAACAAMAAIAVALTPRPDLAATDAGLVNDARSQSGLHALAVDARLAKIAQNHADRLARHRTLAHNAGLGRAVRRSGVCTRVVGENIGYAGGRSASNAIQLLHQDYMHSTIHRDNILSGGYKLVGVGVSKRHGSVWNVEDFVAPC